MLIWASFLDPNWRVFENFSSTSFVVKGASSSFKVTIHFHHHHHLWIVHPSWSITIWPKKNISPQPTFPCNKGSHFTFLNTTSHPFPCGGPITIHPPKNGICDGKSLYKPYIKWVFMGEKSPQESQLEKDTIPKISLRGNVHVAVHRGNVPHRTVVPSPNIPWFGASPWLASWSLSPYVATLDERQRPAPLLQRCCANVPGPDPNTFSVSSANIRGIYQIPALRLREWSGERAVFFFLKISFFLFFFGFWSSMSSD